MRRVAPPRPAKQGTFDVRVLPPPIGGWNKRDALPLMDPKDAILLDNWIPDTNSVRQRYGFSTWATIAATATAVESLIQYAPPTTANKKLFAATPSTIYDVTANVTASSTAAVVTSLSNGRWQHSQMTNTAGNFLVLVNGADQPRKFEGTTWSTCSVSASGLTRTNLISVHNHMNRLWFIEENQPHVWYGDTAAVEGVLTKFQLPFRMGGKLLAMGSWTRDGGTGPDDYAVFLSTTGECIVYAGTDPSSSTTSALVGIYTIPEPIGRRCIVPAGADLGILTSQGLIPLSKVLGMTQGSARRVSFTDKISGQFRSQYQTTGTSFGWQCLEYPKENLLVINVPIAERVTQHQYVMNVNTGAWCRFTNINAGCWALLGDALYFGGNDGVVYKYNGTQDGSSNIVSLHQSAYTTLGSPKNKRFLRVRPKFLAPTGYDPPITVKTDYDDSIPAVNTVATATGGTQWNAGQWNSFQWAGGSVTSQHWQGISGQGSAVSVAFGVSSADTLTYNGTDLGFEAGNFA